MEIKKEHCEFKNFSIDKENSIRKRILPGEIKTVETFYLKITEKGFKHKKKKNSRSIFLLFKGAGIITEGNSTYHNSEEIAVFVPSDTEDVSIYAVKGILEVLEIELMLSDDDLFFLSENRKNLPYFNTYSKCRQYKESIKSKKTINRMILPENIVPRFCMGSVETSGPDKIKEHNHPMLEQLFFGLQNNNCIVRADNQETLFKEYELLHIPLGSVHGVEVREGKFLHYIWIDYFKSQEEMKYISENHILNE